MNDDLQDTQKKGALGVEPLPGETQGMPPPFRFLWIIGQWPSTLRALRHRNYRYFWFGQLISLIGSWMQTVAYGWLVFTLAREEVGPANVSFYLGLVAAMGSVPMLLFTLLAGVVADRYDKRRILILTQTSFMLLAFLLAGMTAAHVIRLWHVFVLAALTGIVGAFDMPVRQAFVKDMVGMEDLVNAIALNSSIFNGARIVGPAVAGWLISLRGVGIPGAFFINGLSFIAVIAGLLMIRTARGLTPPEGESMLSHLIEGFRYVARHRVIRLIMIVMGIYSVFGFSYAVLLPVVASQVLGRGASGYGLLLAFGGVGALAGALLLATMAGRIPKGRLLLAGGSLFSIALIALSQSHLFALSAALLALVAGGLVLSSASINCLVQETAPDELRGRVVSMWTFIFAGFMPVGSVLTGTVANLTSPLTAILLSGCACLGVIVFLTVRARWVWRLE